MALPCISKDPTNPPDITANAESRCLVLLGIRHSRLAIADERWSGAPRYFAALSNPSTSSARVYIARLPSDVRGHSRVTH